MTIPGMSVAGRGFTSYVSSSIMNNILKENYKIDDNLGYKEYIQKNGETMSSDLYGRSKKLVKKEQWWSKK